MAAAASLRLPPMPSISEILRIFKLRALRQLSQNFFLDTNMINKFVREAGNLKDVFVVEVGPGPGGITRSLLQHGVKSLTVIEKDRRFLPMLQLVSDASKGRLKIIRGDVLDVDLVSLFPSEGKRHLVGNLPFNISLPLLIRLMRGVSQGPPISQLRMTLTFQREVAERMGAPPGDRQRSRLSIMVQAYCHVNIKFLIPGSCFVPPPKVDAAVVSLKPRSQPQIQAPFDAVEKLVRCLFQHRKKYCIYGLKTLFPPEAVSLAEELLKTASVDGTRTAPSLTIEEFNALACAYMEVLTRFPELESFMFREPMIS